MCIFQNTAGTGNRVKQVAGTPTCSQQNTAAALAFVPHSLGVCSFSPLQINKLVEYYQQLAQKEKIERDRKKLVRRRNYMPLAFSVSWEFCAERSDSFGSTIGLLSLFFVENNVKKMC